MTPYNSLGTCLLGNDAPRYPSPSYQNSIPTSLSPPLLLPYPNSPTLPPPSRSKPASSPSTFPLFTHLPPELRLKIWHLTLPPPRLVQLNYQSSTSRITALTPKSHRGCTSSAPLPITLHINHESRTLALQHYSLSFGLSGGISYPGARATSLPGKIYFSAERGDVLFFGVKVDGDGQEGMKSFVNACMMVHPEASGFGQVKRLAVQKGLFTGGGGKGVTEMQLRKFWERVMGKFTGFVEVIFVDKGEDALLRVSERGLECRLGRDEVEVCGGRRMEGSHYADDRLGVTCWEEERFEEKVKRVVRSLEAECGWVAPRWRVLERRRESLDMRMEGLVIETQTRREKEEVLVRQMRGLFGYENISNAM